MRDNLIYRRDDRGWREFETDPMIGKAMLSIASGIASSANASGSSLYRARRVMDPGGRANLPREAAEVYTDRSSMGDAQARKLLTVSQSYRSRGFGDV